MMSGVGKAVWMRVWRRMVSGQVPVVVEHKPWSRRLSWMVGGFIVTSFVSLKNYLTYCIARDVVDNDKNLAEFRDFHNADNENYQINNDSILLANAYFTAPPWFNTPLRKRLEKSSITSRAYSILTDITQSQTNKQLALRILLNLAEDDKLKYKVLSDAHIEQTLMAISNVNDHKSTLFFHMLCYPFLNIESIRKLAVSINYPNVLEQLLVSDDVYLRRQAILSLSSLSDYVEGKESISSERIMNIVPTLYESPNDDPLKTIPPNESDFVNQSANTLLANVLPSTYKKDYYRHTKELLTIYCVGSLFTLSWSFVRHYFRHRTLAQSTRGAAKSLVGAYLLMSVYQLKNLALSTTGRQIDNYSLYYSLEFIYNSLIIATAYHVAYRAPFSLFPAAAITFVNWRLREENDYLTNDFDFLSKLDN